MSMILKYKAVFTSGTRASWTNCNNQMNKKHAEPLHNCGSRHVPKTWDVQELQQLARPKIEIKKYGEKKSMLSAQASMPHDAFEVPQR